MRKHIISEKKLNTKPRLSSPMRFTPEQDRVMRVALRYLRDLGPLRRLGCCSPPVKNSNISQNEGLPPLTLNLDCSNEWSPEKNSVSPFGFSDEQPIPLTNTNARDLSLLELFQAQSPINLD